MEAVVNLSASTNQPKGYASEIILL